MPYCLCLLCPFPGSANWVFDLLLVWESPRHCRVGVVTLRLRLAFYAWFDAAVPQTWRIFTASPCSVYLLRMW